MRLYNFFYPIIVLVAMFLVSFKITQSQTLSEDVSKSPTSALDENLSTNDKTFVFENVTITPPQVRFAFSNKKGYIADINRKRAEDSCNNFTEKIAIKERAKRSMPHPLRMELTGQKNSNKNDSIIPNKQPHDILSFPVISNLFERIIQSPHDNRRKFHEIHLLFNKICNEIRNLESKDDYNMRETKYKQLNKARELMLNWISTLQNIIDSHQSPDVVEHLSDVITDIFGLYDDLFRIKNPLEDYVNCQKFEFLLGSSTQVLAESSRQQTLIRLTVFDYYDDHNKDLLALLLSSILKIAEDVFENGIKREENPESSDVLDTNDQIRKLISERMNKNIEEIEFYTPDPRPLDQLEYGTYKVTKNRPLDKHTDVFIDVICVFIGKGSKGLKTSIVL